MITGIPFAEKHSGLSIFEPGEGTLVVVPSLSLPQDEMRRITGARCYEERLLFLLLTLRRPGVKVIYLSSAPVDSEIVDYYLGFLDRPDDAAKRLHLITADEPTAQPLTRTVLRRPDVLARLRDAMGDPADAWMVPFIVGPDEHRLAEAFGIPLYGPAVPLAHLGHKTGARQLAEQAAVPVAPGFADLRSLPEAEHAARALGAARRLIVKLNDGYSGLGNAIVARPDPGHGLTGSPTSFSAAGETWESFAQKICERGAVLEEFIEERPLHHPSALARITPGGRYDVVATHDQVLGGPNNDVYLGCTFPAGEDYRRQVTESAGRISALLAERGVVGLFSMDFFAMKTDAGYRALLCEINLRMGGTTHPFGAALLTTNASYDPGTGTLMRGTQPKHYAATDNCAAPCLRGRTPGEVVRLVERLGLGFDRERRTGNVLHLLGAVPEYGKLGFTSIGDSAEEAAELHRATRQALCGDPPP